MSNPTTQETTLNFGYLAHAKSLLATSHTSCLTASVAAAPDNISTRVARAVFKNSKPQKVELQEFAEGILTCDATCVFLTQYTTNLKNKILTAEYLVLDLETTNLTCQQQPIRIGKATRLAGTTYNQYLQVHPECTINITPRIRILTVSLPDATVLAFDFDALSEEEQKEISHDCINNKIIVGQNIGFDFSWLRYYTKAQPQRVLDSMVIVKVFRHGLPVRIHMQAANSDASSIEYIKALDAGLAGFSLEAMCIATGLPKPDKTFQKPQNWAVSHLTPEHLEYVAGDVLEPLQIIKTALRLKPDASMTSILDSLKGSIYETAYEPTIFELAVVHHRGMPVDLGALEALLQKQADTIAEQADTLIRLAPVFEPSRDKISAPSGGLTKVVKEAWKELIEGAGLVCPVTAAGGISITQASVKLAGITKNDVLAEIWSAWEALQGAKKRFSMLDEYKYLASHDGKLHSLIGLNARTIRMSSTAPNSQNFPRDPEFRAIVTGGEGYKILSVDYGQIELRIAAALALRAIEEARVSKSKEVLEAIRIAESDTELERLLTPEDCAKSAKKWREKTIRELQHAWRDMTTMGCPLAEVFRHGLDPHLLTGIETLRKQAVLNFEGSAIKWMQMQDVSELKAEYKEARQQAKAQNFGLLYGMGAGGLYGYGVTSYGLSWSKEDAVEARDAWFGAYPDVRIWHALTNLDFTRHQLFVKPAFGGYGAKPDFVNQKIFTSRTLAGREVITTARKDALNYSDQGTGADMLARAIAILPHEAKQYLVNLIHDEMLFCVPDAEVEAVAATVVKYMNTAGDEFLSKWNIPCEAEAGISDVWEH